MEVDVVDDHEIGESISVIIAECGAGRPPAVGDAGLCRHVGEGAIAVVAVENVAAETGEIKIGPAVVVVVSHGAAHGEAGSGQAGLGSDVGKRAVVVVMVENAEALRALEGHVDRWAHS